MLGVGRCYNPNAVRVARFGAAPVEGVGLLVGLGFLGLLVGSGLVVGKHRHKG